MLTFTAKPVRSEATAPLPTDLRTKVQECSEGGSPGQALTRNAALRVDARIAQRRVICGEASRSAIRKERPAWIEKVGQSHEAVIARVKKLRNNSARTDDRRPTNDPSSQ